MKHIFPPHAYGEAPREMCYWTSTVEAPDYPRAQGRIEADVAIIGAGYTGISAALKLAESGANAVVLDAQHPGFGASGRNGGFCCLGGAAASDQMMRLQHGEAARQEFRKSEVEAAQFARSLIDRLKIECDTHSEGETLMAHTPKAIDSLKAHAEDAERDYGFATRFIPGTDLEANGMGRDGAPFFAALTVPTGVAINPLKYLLGLAGAATQAGARIFARSAVTSIARDRAFTLTTPEATVQAGKLIVATNGYSSDDLPKWMGGRYIPTQSNVIVTRELTEEEITAQNWSTLQMCYDDRFFMHYFRLMPNRRMLFGMRGGLFSSPASDIRMHRTIRHHFETMFPHWAHVESPYSWHGLLALSRDLTPFVGPIPEMPGAFTSLCYHGNGVAMGSYAGAILADLAQGKSPENLYPRIMKKPHKRFPLGRFRRATLWPLYAWAHLRGE